MQSLRTSSTVVLSAVAALLGLVLIVETAIVGGSLGYLLGALLFGAGALRLALVRRSR